MLDECQRIAEEYPSSGQRRLWDNVYRMRRSGYVVVWLICARHFFGSMVYIRISRCRLLAFAIPPRVIRLAAIPVVYGSLNGHVTWNPSAFMLSAVRTVSLFVRCNPWATLSNQRFGQRPSVWLGLRLMVSNHPSVRKLTKLRVLLIWMAFSRWTRSSRCANGHSRTIHIDPRLRPLGWSKQASSVAMLAIEWSASIAIWSVSNGHCRAMIPGRYTAHSRPSVRTSWPSKLNRDRRRFRSSTIKDRQQQTEVTRCGWATSYTGLHVIRTLSIFQDVRLRFRHGQRRTCPRWMFLFERASSTRARSPLSPVSTAMGRCRTGVRAIIRWSSTHVGFLNVHTRSSCAGLTFIEGSVTLSELNLVSTEGILLETRLKNVSMSD